MIELVNLSKVFRKPIRQEGVLGMFKTLFSKKYEEKVAVNNISFKIDSGEIVGYIGSNGAGKSTTIKMMCGILMPTSGKVLIDGEEPYKKRKKLAQKIGVVFGQKTQLWWDIALIETFKVLKEVYQITDEDYKERMDFMNEVLGIGEFINQPVRTLSLGQRMRADLAASWIHNPEILFLDEPTIGLDVLVKQRIRDAIKLMNEKYHTTVILTTHDMTDIESLCSRVILIDKGNIIYDGPIENIKHKFGDIRTVEIKSKEELVVEELNTFDNLLTYKLNEGSLSITFDNDKIKLETIVNYAFQELAAVDMKISEISIEDIVKSILEKDEK